MKELKNFVWTDECQDAFDKLKQISASKPILAQLDTRKRFRVSYVSECGLGAMFGDDGIERIVWYAGRALNEAEKRYTTGERELLAVRWAIYRFRCYLYDTEFDGSQASGSSKYE